jgi:hypothetical protein
MEMGLGSFTVAAQKVQDPPQVRAEDIFFLLM